MPKTMTFDIQAVLIVHDGDTLTVVLDRGFNDYSTRGVRVMGIDAPEVTGPTKPQGAKVRDVAAYWLQRSAAVGVCRLISYALDEKYGRVLGDVVAPNGELLTDYLLRNKLAKPYNGGTKSVWTAADLAVVDAWKV